MPDCHCAFHQRARSIHVQIQQCLGTCQHQSMSPSRFLDLCSECFCSFSPYQLLQLQVEQQRQAHEENAKNDNMWIGVAPDIKNRAAYTDFIGAQTKVSFCIVQTFPLISPQFAHRSCHTLRSCFVLPTSSSVSMRN